MAAPRVAVVGGGITGSLAALILRMRGADPLLIDAGKRGVGGRLTGYSAAGGDAGAQFIRAQDPRLMSLLAMLEGEGLVRRWEGRFGILGEKGGFLSADVVGNTAMQAMMSNANSLQPGNNGATTNSNEAMPFATDAGDLCNFVGGMASGGPLFVGHPTMASLCPGICARASIDVLVGRVLAAHRDEERGGWRLDLDAGGDGHYRTHFDALVLATHDPSLAAATVRSIADAELGALKKAAAGDGESSSSSSDDDDDEK